MPHTSHRHVGRLLVPFLLIGLAILLLAGTASALSMTGGGSVLEERGATSASITITKGTGEVVPTVNLAFTGTATTGTDVACAPGDDYIVLGPNRPTYSGGAWSYTSFPASGSQTLTLTACNDSASEPDKTVSIAASCTGCLGATAAATVWDDEPLVSLSTAPVNTYWSERPSYTQETFTTTRSSNHYSLSIPSVASGTAIPGTDYTTSGTTFSLPSGTSSTAITASAVDDQVDRGTRAATLTLAACSPAGPSCGYALGTPSATASLLDDDSSVSFSVASQTVNWNVGTAHVQLTRTNPIDQTTVFYKYGGTAQWTKLSGTPFNDYGPLSGYVTFPAGVATIDIDVPVNGARSSPNDVTVNFKLYQHERWVGTDLGRTIRDIAGSSATDIWVLADGCTAQCTGNAYVYHCSGAPPCTWDTGTLLASNVPISNADASYGDRIVSFGPTSVFATAGGRIYRCTGGPPCSWSVMPGTPTNIYGDPDAASIGGTSASNLFAGSSTLYGGGYTYIYRCTPSSCWSSAQIPISAISSAQAVNQFFGTGTADAWAMSSDSTVRHCTTTTTCSWSSPTQMVSGTPFALAHFLRAPTDLYLPSTTGIWNCNPIPTCVRILTPSGQLEGTYQQGLDGPVGGSEYWSLSKGRISHMDIGYTEPDSYALDTDFRSSCPCVYSPGPGQAYAGRLTTVYRIAGVDYEGYSLGTQATHVMTIRGTTPTVSISIAPGAVTEGQPATLTLSRDASQTASAIVVNLGLDPASTASGTSNCSTAGTNFVAPASSYTMTAGAATRSVVLQTCNDGSVGPTLTAGFRVLAGAGYFVGNPDSANVSIRDIGPVSNTVLDGHVFDEQGNDLGTGPWGGWTAIPGATNVDSNYLRATNTGSGPGALTVNFVDAAFARAGGGAIPITSNIKFCYASGTPAQVPADLLFNCQDPASPNSLSVAVPAGQRLWMNYRILTIPDPCTDGDYVATYTATVS